MDSDANHKTDSFSSRIPFKLKKNLVEILMKELEPVAAGKDNFEFRKRLKLRQFMESSDYQHFVASVKKFQTNPPPQE